MIDHAPYIRAKQQAEQENAEMAEMEKRSAPLLWAVYVAVFAVTLSFAIEGLSGHIQRYSALAAQEEALVQCLNGRVLQLGTAFIRCDVSEYQLVSLGGRP